MPIYEFYCPDCHRVFSFLSRSVNTQARPLCPRCRRRSLERQITLFSAPRRGRSEGSEEEGEGDLPVDEARMEQAMETLADDAESIDEDDPRQAVRMMRRFSDLTGLRFNEKMEEAMKRLEAGEDPEAIEADMGDMLDEEEPFELPGSEKKSRRRRIRRFGEPERDPTLYEL